MEESLEIRKIYLNSSNFTFGTVSQPTFILEPAIDIKYFKVIDAQIPLSYFVINSTNNCFNLYEFNNASPFLLHIPQGNYSIDTLVTEIQFLLNNCGASNLYNVTYQNEQNKLIITSNMKEFKLDFIVPFSSNKILGFSKLNNFDFTINKTLISTFEVDLSGTRNILIGCPNLNSRSIVPFSNKNILCKIPIKNSHNTIEYFSDNATYFDKIYYPTTISDISFILYDEETLTPIDLNGLPFSITIAVML